MHADPSPQQPSRKPPRPFPVYPKAPMKHGGGAKIKIAGKSYYLGKHGSEESIREYERLRMEHARGAITPKLTALGSSITIDEMVAAWIANNPRGIDDPQVIRVARSCKPLCVLFGKTRADEFRANRLRAVQEAMIDGRWRAMADAGEHSDKRRARPWRRGYINKSIERIVMVFGWAESRELVPMGIKEHLRTLAPLKSFDRRVETCPPRKPVNWETQVVPCLPFLSPVVRAMVIVQYLGGMRPSEVITMRRREIDQTKMDGVWLYTPERHKGAWRGHDLVKVLGPKAQVVLAPWLMAAEPDDFVFVPAKRRLGANRYTCNGYGQAIRRAIKLAGVAPWSLYQLRHSAGHAAEVAGGLTGAAAFLGHHSLETTKTYTDKVRLGVAVDIAKKIG